MIRLFPFMVLIVILLSSSLAAEVPQLISYQGRITDPGNNPVPDGNYEITFGIYDVEFGGTPFWAETLSTVGVQNGLFNVILGATTPFGGPAKQNAAPSVWLGVQVGTDLEISPRTQLLSVPFAFDADRADTAQFSYNSQYAIQADTAFHAFGAIWSDTAGYASGAHWSDTSDYAFSSGSADTSDHALSVADGSIELSDIGPNGADDGQIIKWNESLSTWETVDETVGTGDITAVNAGTGLTGGGTSGDVVLGISNNGVTSTHIQDGTIGPSDLSSFGATDGQMLKWNSSLVSWEVVDEAGDISSVTAGLGLAGGGTSGDVSLGIPGNAVNSAMITDNTLTDADISGSAAIAPTKISGTAATLSGDNSFTGIQNSFDSLVGIGTNTPTPQSKLHVVSDSQYAGYFTSNYSGNGSHIIHAEYTGSDPGSYSPIAVYGLSTTADAGGQGGYFIGGSKGVSGRVYPSGNLSYTGVTALVSGGSGTNYGTYTSAAGGGKNYGLRAYVTGGTASYAIYGSVGTSSGVIYAGYFDGDVNVVGTLSKGAGSFKIDHPLDPANKYLYHSFVESPDMMNVYNGNVTLDASGEATISLPDYFGALNKDFRYQLTAIGAPGPNLYIAEKIQDNSFRISGGSSGMEVSWQVTGIRKDPYAEANRIQVEVDKSDEDRGIYVHPEAIGLDETQSIDYKHRPQNDEFERQEN